MTMQAAKKGHTRRRTFTGCWTCRSRKVKCDEKKPTCLTCSRIGLACTGYGPKLVWVEDENQPYSSSGRRYIECESVWKSLPVLQSEVVDYLISTCDGENNHDISYAGLTQVTSIKPTHNPFRSFRFGKAPSEASISRSPPPPGSIDCISSNIYEKLLFNHYINHVAFIMMPFEHMRNPWKSSYPAAALCDAATDRNALYSALLAHSAFNLAQLDVEKDQMQVLATRYYLLAVQQLRAGMGCSKGKYAYTVAIIMTLMMAEIYSGHSKTWRHHLKGAWALLCEDHESEPWLESDFACVSTQSLYIITIISETTAPQGQLEWGQSTRPQDEASYHHNIDPLGTSIISTSDFGFTIGASKTILQCISRITKLAYYPTNDGPSSLNDLDLADILSCLKDAEEILECQEELHDSCNPKTLPSGKYLAYHQLKAFVLATYIYLYRVIYHLQPQELTTYVTETFKHISAFSKENGGNMSLWPAFIAAAEACTEEDMGLAKDWMDEAISFGLGNRVSIKKVIEEVWRRRRVAAVELQVDQSSVGVDWRQVMHDLDLDVLLV